MTERHRDAVFEVDLGRLDGLHSMSTRRALPLPPHSQLGPSIPGLAWTCRVGSYERPGAFGTSRIPLDLKVALGLSP